MQLTVTKLNYGKEDVESNHVARRLKGKSFAPGSCLTIMRTVDLQLYIFTQSCTSIINWLSLRLSTKTKSGIGCAHKTNLKMVVHETSGLYTSDNMYR
jgi:hypothetical protein